MNDILRYSIFVFIMMAQSAQGAGSWWKFWEKDTSKSEQTETAKDTSMNEGTQKVIAQDEVQQFINDHERAVVMFILSKCPFCIYLKPKFEELSQDPRYSGSVYFKIVTVKAGKKNYYKKTYGFSTFPTVIYYKNGEQKAIHGSENRRMTVEKMRRYIESSFGL